MYFLPYAILAAVTATNSTNVSISCFVGSYVHTLSFDTFSLVEAFDRDVARNSQAAAIKYKPRESLFRPLL